MRFSILLITAAIVASVNAGNVQKRETSEPVQVCRNKLKEATSKLISVKNGLDKFTSKSGYLTVLSIQFKEQTLDRLLQEANNLCCRDSHVISTDDIEESVGIISPLVDEALHTLKLLGEKKPEFDNTLLATFLVVSDIKSMERHTKALLHCFTEKSPDNHRATGRGFSRHLDGVFSKLRIIYNF